MDNIRKALVELLRACDDLKNWEFGEGNIASVSDAYLKAEDGARAALAEQSTPTEFHNPWRESLENCISGDNYLRAREYRDLIEELDDLYRLRTALAEQPSVREPLTDEQITRVWFESASGKITPTPIEFARAIEAMHGIGVKGEA